MKKTSFLFFIIILFGCKISVAQSDGVLREGPKASIIDAPVTEVETLKDADIFDRAEEMPQFPGGPAVMMKYLKDNLKYPSLAKENGLEGKVIVKFIVDIDGSAIEPVVIKDNVGSGAAEESIRLIKAMPKWIPGKQRGKPVKVYYVLPVTFRL